MEFVTKQDDIKKIEEGVKNKWRWEWVENDDLLRQYIKKIKLPGQAFCILCNRTLRYQSSGKKDLQRHITSPPHQAAMRNVKSNYSLDSKYF